MGDTRGYHQGGYGLEIAGKFAGMLKSCEAPGVKGDKADMKTGVSNITKKAIANISYDDTKFSVAMSMSKDLQDWIQASFNMKHEYRDCALLAADFHYNEQRRINLHQALIKEVKFSDLDAASKDAIYTDVTMACEMVRHQKGSGGAINTALGARMKDWLCANFRIDIPGLTDAVPFVSKISLPNFSQKTTLDQVGHLKENSLLPTAVELGDLTVTFGSGPDGKVEDQLMAMADKWFIQGDQVEENHLSISVHFLKPNMKDELGAINYQGCGLLSVKPAKSERGDGVRKIECKWYIELATCNFQGQG
jgi:hypothetical protein